MAKEFVFCSYLTGDTPMVLHGFLRNIFNVVRTSQETLPMAFTACYWDSVTLL
jgi:hypothetical protein